LFGLLEIGAGILLALAIPMLFFAATMRPPMPQPSTPPPAAGQPQMAAPIDVKMMIPGMVLSLLASVWFISMGIGSIRCRRWARALVLISASFGLIMGIGAMCMVVMFLPKMFGPMPNGAPMQHTAVFLYAGVVFPLLFYVVLPGLTVLFYKSKHVKATVERRNPQICWTDRCPLPVLAISLVCALGVLTCLVSAIMAMSGVAVASAAPFFGYIFSGPMAILLYLIFVVLMGYVALGSYKLNVRAWWCAAVMAIVSGASAIANAFLLNPMDIYGKMNLPAAQLEEMQKFSPMQSPYWMGTIGVLWAVVVLGYLLYAKRFFKGK
jgi:hypothetical protein